jgi:NTP pyrophosphatase (non-canonical NTP hydrolase)
MEKEEIQKISQKIKEVLEQEIKNPISEYQKICKATAKNDYRSPPEEIMTWGLGIAGEAGDVASCIKKTFAHDNDQRAGIRENVGDTLWYSAMICNFFGWDMAEVLNENVEKLRKRFPNGFTSQDASRGNTMIDWNENRLRAG